jgi:hypothetical protein
MEWQRCNDTEYHEYSSAGENPTRKGVKKKGSPKLAREGENCKVLIAYNCRDKPNNLRDRFPSQLETEGITDIPLGQDCSVNPSQLLSNVDWVTNMINLFDLGYRSAEVSEEEKLKADELLIKLKERSRDHIDERVEDKKKHTHWCLKLAKKNLAVNAALMVLSEHVKDDLSVCGLNEDLLAVNPSRFRACTEVPSKEGAYLYFDRNNYRFIRSGKVTRRGFEVRHQEHFKASKAPQSSSDFYMFYPSLESPRCRYTTKRGVFEKLVQLVGAGFTPTSDSAKAMDRDWTEGGMLIMSNEDKKKIKTSMGTKVKELQKFQDICAYQLEFGYDLAIGPGNNVSRSPGFESVLGVVFGGNA